MRRYSFAVALLLTSFTSVAQQPAAPKAKPAPAAKAAPAKPASAKPPADSSLPTEATVNSFMKRMFGYSPTVTWKIVDIAPSEAPGVARVVIAIGDGGQSQAFYVLPGGEFAMVGEVIPFGADPFGPAREKLKAQAHGPSKGSQSAPVLLVEFSDLQCPHCKSSQPIIDKLIAESPNARLVFQPFPIASLHPWATKAAEYADCVAQQNPDAFWKFTNSVYDAQADIKEPESEKKFLELATAAGVDGAKAATCAAQGNTYIKIQKSIDLGKEVGVSGTPTLFINGRKVQNVASTPFEQLKAMVAYEAPTTAKK
ncbi:MAG: oxidoreductase [Acidobacteriales bacterium]|nr:oxidoreductase [Terriglobales bacterium]